MRAIDGDALKRRAQMDATEAWKLKLTARVETTLNQFIDWINQAPTIEPERKTGKWIGADSQCGIGCPFCGTPVDDFCSSIDYIDLSYEPNFCPNCGADMREGEDG